MSLWGSQEGAGGSGGGGRMISLDGPTEVAVTAQGVYTITDYDAFSEYEITASQGSVSRDGDTITYTAPSAEGSDSLTLTVDGESRSISVTVTGLGDVVGVALRATGGPGGTFDHIDADGNTITSPDAAWFDAHPIWGAIQDVVVDGQDMVDIPKFYYKRGTAGGDAAWWISPDPIDGFEVFPAFLLDGVEVDSFQVGKYQGSESDGKMQSIPGVLPVADITIGTAISQAEARNAGTVEGFRLLHYDMWLAIQWLYLIEHATMDSQTETGEGRVNESTAADVDAADVAEATYRGMVGLWGNVRPWIDGVRTNSSVIERRTYAGDWASTGETVPNGGDTTFPIDFRTSSPDSFIPDDYSLSNDNSATVPDYMRWRNSGEYYPHVGGDWGNGSLAGLWFVTCVVTSSFSSGSFGGRLARVVS
ncbi:MAG: hypothetical protein ACOC0M_00055 [Halomonas sp.]